MVQIPDAPWVRDPERYSNMYYSTRPAEDEEEEREYSIPLWSKYTLSIDEAARYFRIGENKLRKIISENPDADFVLHNGNRVQIKRRLFEEYIDRCNEI